MRSRARGASSTGCLISLLVFVALLYYGVNIGELWFRYYQYVDEMKTQARLAAALDNETIRRRLQAKAQDLGLPAEAQRIAIVRTASPREIRIEASYSQSVNLPLFRRTFHFRPRATQPL
ncbi:MAG TPA: hypothetical protein VNI61_03610 [Gemmatimonadales bacterium]|nr:hypothetical protein [Gemmatimonadales bacterium]